MRRGPARVSLLGQDDDWEGAPLRLCSKLMQTPLKCTASSSGDVSMSSVPMPPSSDCCDGISPQLLMLLEALLFLGIETFAAGARMDTGKEQTKGKSASLEPRQHGLIMLDNAT